MTTVIGQELCAEVAWAAGLFEGEGCIRVGAKRRDIGLYLCTTDRDVLERFAEILGAGRVSTRRPLHAKAHWKQVWYWNCSGAAARHCLNVLLPGLGARRVARALEAIAVYDSLHSEKTCDECGQGYIATAKNQRWCGADCRYVARLRFTKEYNAKRRLANA